MVLSEEKIERNKEIAAIIIVSLVGIGLLTILYWMVK